MVYHPPGFESDHFNTFSREVQMSGLCGVVSRQNCADVLLFGTDYHSHLGSQLAGMAIVGDTFRKKIHDISQGQFKSKFGEEYSQMTGEMGIGVISDSDAQPLIIHSRFGTYAIAFAGLLDNKAALTGALFAKGATFSETSSGEINSVELIAKLIENGSDLPDGIAKVSEFIKGSASILVLTREGLYAARDSLGRTPLILGEHQGDFMVATEASAFPNMEFRPVKHLGPGEIVFITRDGWRVVKNPGRSMQICSFLWIYTGYPASNYEGVGVEQVRERCGGFLAIRDSVEADLVSGVPDSGVGHAIGYSMESRLPFRRVLVKYTPGYGRSYIPPSQAIRDKVAKMKLIPVPEVTTGNRIVLCEDSIVRGTQLRNFTVQKLWDSGAREVHVRPACPPLMFPCKFALSTREVDELIARRAIRAMDGNDRNLNEYLETGSPGYKAMVDWVCRYINATTLRYLSLEDMISAIGLPRESLCNYCWTGREN
jgi:amidophosphoribosyltransferase